MDADTAMRTGPAITRRLALGGIAATAFAGRAQAACEVQERTTVGLSTARGLILVSVEVNGTPASFVLDTGAARSAVTPAAVQRLKMTRDQWVGTTMSGLGGVNRRANADTSSFSIGGVKLVRPTLNHDTSLTVADIPSAAGPGPLIDGLLGRDYLSVFDLDLNVPARTLTLYEVRGCSGRFLPWSAQYAAMPVTTLTDEALIVPVTLDGVELRALVDTGAAASLLASPGIYRMRLEGGGDRTVQISGVGSRTTEVGQHAFQTLQIGALTVHQPQILVAPVHLTPIADMLLGADWLATRRIWISYATRQLFFSA
jgi:predicted aspartyl protease